MALTIVNVVGAGHSGSTLLGKTLGSHPDMLAVGELANFATQLRLDSLCGCGQTVWHCALHSRFIKEIEQKYHLDLRRNPDAFSLTIPKTPSIVSKLKKRLDLKRIAGGSKHQGVFGPMVRNVEFAYQQLAALSGKDIIVDTSKSGVRALVMMRAQGAQTPIRHVNIHLVRDGRAVMLSYGKKTRTVYGAGPDGTDLVVDRYPNQIMPPPKAAALWAEDVRFAELLTARDPNTLLIRYEDFTQDPAAVSQKICEAIGVPYNPLMLDLTHQQVHMLGGNVSRLNARKIERMDDRWRSQITAEEQAMFAALYTPINNRYGYTE